MLIFLSVYNVMPVFYIFFLISYSIQSSLILSVMSFCSSENHLIPVSCLCCSCVDYQNVFLREIHNLLDSCVALDCKLPVCIASISLHQRFNFFLICHNLCLSVYDFTTYLTFHVSIKWGNFNPSNIKIF